MYLYLNKMLFTLKMLKPLSNGEITYQNYIRFNKVSVREELYQHRITSFVTMTCYIIMVVSLCAGTIIGHFKCSATTSCDDLAVLASLAIGLQMILYIIEYYIYRIGTNMTFRQ